MSTRHRNRQATDRSPHWVPLLLTVLLLPAVLIARIGTRSSAARRAAPIRRGTGARHRRLRIVIEAERPENEERPVIVGQQERCWRWVYRPGGGIHPAAPMICPAPVQWVGEAPAFGKERVAFYACAEHADGLGNLTPIT